MDAAPAAAIAIACQSRRSALSGLPAPSARAIEEATAPPRAPPGRVCISISSGNASAIAASGAVPRVPTTQTSVMLTKDCMKKATLLGVARAISSPRGGALSKC